jgi:hypothetical protein
MNTSCIFQKTSFHLTHLFNPCLRNCHFPRAWKEIRIKTLPKPGKDSRCPQNLRPTLLLPFTGKVFETLILITIRKTHRKLIKCKSVGFQAYHSITLHYMRLDHVTTDFNINTMYADTYCVFGYRERLQENTALWPTAYCQNSSFQRVAISYLCLSSLREILKSC